MENKAPLPQFVKPESFDTAVIYACTLARTLHEHAYLFGKHLNWLLLEFKQTKKERKRDGGFWVFACERFNISDNTGRYYMAHAIRCDEAGYLLPYNPGIGKSHGKKAQASGYADVYGAVNSILANYFPEAHSLAQHDESDDWLVRMTGDERRQKALRRLLSKLTNDQKALILTGVYLAGGLVEKAKAA